jgi:hypothetical protein
MHTTTAITYWIIQCFTKWRSYEPFSPVNTLPVWPATSHRSQGLNGLAILFKGCSCKVFQVEGAEDAWEEGTDDCGEEWELFGKIIFGHCLV